jgi:hypothetical protein
MKKHVTGILLCLLFIASPALAQSDQMPDGFDGAAPSVSRPQQVRRFVVPLILAAGDTTANTQFNFDTTIFMTYTPGLAGIGAGPGATVDLYLFNNTDGGVLFSLNTGQAVCNPCSFPLGLSNRRQSIRIDGLIMNAGAFDAGVKLGFAVIVVGGSDPDGVNLQGPILPALPGALNLSVFGFEPQPISAR